MVGWIGERMIRVDLAEVRGSVRNLVALQAERLLDYGHGLQIVYSPFPPLRSSPAPVNVAMGADPMPPLSDTPRNG